MKTKISKNLTGSKVVCFAVVFFILFFLFVPKNEANAATQRWPDNIFVYAYYSNGQQVQCSNSCYYRLTWLTSGAYGPSYSGTVSGRSFPDFQFVQTLTACNIIGPSPGCNSRYLYPGTAIGPPGSTFLYASPAIINWVSGPARVYYYFSAPNPTTTTTSTTTTLAPTTTTTLSPTTTTSTTTTTTTTTTLAPTLNVAPSVNPSSGPAPLTSTLTASVSGTATGTINYTFWWNCNYGGTSVSTAISQCGDPDGTAGNANGNKYDGITANPKSSIPHIYSSAGTYTAKVIAERGPLAKEDRETITVTSGNPTGCLDNCGGGNYGAFPGDYCSGLTATVTWQYSDPNGDPQSAYQVQVDDQASFDSPVLDTGKIFSSGNSYTIGAGVLQFDITYRARVRVWDSNDNVSSWDVSDSWKTPKHAYPQVNFNWSPLSPNANQSVQFTDQTTFYDSGGGSRNWSWLFGDGGSSVQQNPTHTYTTLNNYNINLTVEDKDDYTCSNIKTITVKKPVPFWREVSPKQ